MAEKTTEQWLRCIELIKSKLNAQQYDTWFAHLEYKSYNQKTGELMLSLPSQEIFDYLEKNHRPLLHQAIYHVYGYETKVMFKVEVLKRVRLTEESSPLTINDKEKKKIEKGQVKKAPAIITDHERKDGLKTGLNYDQTFDNFIEGESNRLSRTVGLAIAEHPEQQTFNPLFIWGPSGVGKTHLVNAIGSRLEQLHPKKRVLYIAAHEFMVQFTESRRQNLFNDFMQFYQSIDVLILDDVHEFVSQKGTLDAFFHIFNHLHQNGRHIILTCDRPPSDLTGMEERMLTRFKWGLTAEMQRPEEMLRHNILLSRIRRDGLNIPIEVVDYIAHTVKDSVRELEGAIRSLMAYSIVNNTAIDLAFAKEILEGHAIIKPQVRSKKLTFDYILDTVASFMGVTASDIMSSSRRAEVSMARQIVMYLTIKNTTLTASRIGNLLGGRSHSTVLHGVKTVQNFMDTDDTFRKKVNSILR